MNQFNEAYNNGGAPLSEPLYGASFYQAITRFFTRYARFKGMSSRSEFWWALAFILLASVILSSLWGLVGGSAGAFIASALIAVFSIAIIVPWWALTWRRLHDAGFPGPLAFLYLIPLGALVLFVLCAMPTNRARWNPEWADRG